MKNLRRKRLGELLSSPRFNGDRTAFYQAAGITKGRLSQLLDPSEAFGDVAAKNLCDALSLPIGWFDSTSDTTASKESVKNNQENTSNYALAPAQQARAAINGVATLEQSLEALAHHLSSLDATMRPAAGALLMALAQQPESTSALASLTVLLAPAAFVRPDRKAA